MAFVWYQLKMENTNYTKTWMKRLQRPAVGRVVREVAGFAGVKDLADGVGLVAVLLEVLRQRGEVARGVAPVRVKVVEPGGVWSPGIGMNGIFSYLQGCTRKLVPGCVNMS